MIRIQVTTGDFPIGHKMKIFQNLKNQPLESSPREALDLLALDIFKVPLDRVQGHPVWSVFFQRKFVADDLGGNFQPSIP